MHKDTKEVYLDINRHSWNNRVEAHMESEFYDLKGFLQGNSSHVIEIAPKKYRIKHLGEKIPIVYSLTAIKEKS